MPSTHLPRRAFLGTAAAAMLTATTTGTRAAAKYKRCIVTSAEGQKALASYAKGVAAMLKLPPDHPHNWFRNAFIHLMDCPHGNWWFYVWHRGYLGYFEQTIRSLSGDPDFALPYWDWTQLPQIPDSMFAGVLTPTDGAFKPFTETLDIFTTYFKPSLMTYWNGLSPAQRQQLDQRGYKALGDLWNDVTGNGVPANESFAETSGARYLSKTNPKLDQDTANAVAKNTVLAGLLAPRFYDANGPLSFTSSKTDSHNAAPGQATVFSVLEGQPHNLVHNCIGGVGAINPPWGNMTNFLSPVDPIFFLHHANMDRLWDVWTRKQQHLKEPWLPEGCNMVAKQMSKPCPFFDEPFRFFVDSAGQSVPDGKAGDYFSTARFGYGYDNRGYGENLVGSPSARPAPQVARSVAATQVAGNAASVTVPAAILSQLHASAANVRPLVAQVTLQRPAEPSAARQFRVFVGAPPDATNLGTESPYYAGTVGFFGPQMAAMRMSNEATFLLPLPPKLPALAAPAVAARETNLPIRIVPMNGGGQAAPMLKAFSIGTL